MMDKDAKKIRKEIARMVRITRIIAQSERRSIEFLRAIGMHDRHGNLKPEFGGEPNKKAAP